NNGVIDPNEFESRSGYYLRRAAEQAGLSTSSPIPIDRLVSAMEQSRRDRDSSYGRSSSSSPSSTPSSAVSGQSSPPNAPQPFGVIGEIARLPGFETPLSAQAQLP